MPCSVCTQCCCWWLLAADPVLVTGKHVTACLSGLLAADEWGAVLSVELQHSPCMHPACPEPESVVLALVQKPFAVRADQSIITTSSLLSSSFHVAVCADQVMIVS